MAARFLELSTRFAMLRPIKNKNPPIPAEIPLFKLIGTALTKYFLIGEADRATNNIPLTKIAPKHSSGENPN